MQSTITEQDIIAARQRVAEAERNQEQQDFTDALLASTDLTPEMVKQWLDAGVQVQWCACEQTQARAIVCVTCGLPPYWKSGGATQFVSGARAAYLTRKHGPAAAMEDAWSVWYDHGIKRAYRYYA